MNFFNIYHMYSTLEYKFSHFSCMYFTFKQSTCIMMSVGEFGHLTHKCIKQSTVFLASLSHFAGDIVL